MQNIAMVFVIFTSTMFHKSLCHPSGAPTSQCESMIPNHGPDPQAGASPYKIKVENPYYMPGENVRVSIESSGDSIKGYLIQARQVGGNSATGMFATAPINGKHLNCGNSKGAVTHSTRLSVQTVNFEWEPPVSLSGNISFFATVVKDKATFWVKLQSPELYKREMQPTQSTQPSATTVQANVSTTSSKSTETTKSMAATTVKANVSTTSSKITDTTKSMAASTPTANNTCKPNDPKCDGIQLNNNVLFLFFIGLFLVFWQNAI